MRPIEATTAGAESRGSALELDYDSGYEIPPFEGNDRTGVVTWVYVVRRPAPGAEALRATGSLGPGYAADEIVIDAATPLREQISYVSRFLGLGKSQLARLFGVSRQTIYDWISGSSEPSGENARNLTILARALSGANGVARRPLYHRFVTERTEPDEASVVELLEETPWSEDRLTFALARARRLTDERDRRLGLDRPSSLSRAEEEDNLLDNAVAEDLE